MRAYSNLFVALAATCAVVGSAQAQASQAGGLPALADRVTIVESQVTQVTTLISAMQAKISSLEAANAALNTAVTKLAGDLATERSERISLQQYTFNQISSLQSALAAEQSARIAADQELAEIGSGVQAFAGQPLASFLPNGVETILSDLKQLPAGKYYFTAKADVGSLDVNHNWDCRLLLNGQQLDRATFLTESLGLGAYSGAYENMSLHSYATLAAVGTVEFRCATGDPSSIVKNIQLIGLRISD
jgi:hypothetical protein